MKGSVSSKRYKRRRMLVASSGDRAQVRSVERKLERLAEQRRERGLELERWSS